MDIILYIALGLFGAAFGSFAVAQVWRIRAFQLKEDLASGGEEIDIAEWRKLKPLTNVKKSKDRSHCLDCGYQLKWYDLIPILSWLFLRGKCRKCNKKIGLTEFIAEVSLAILFIISFILWPAQSTLAANGDIFILAEFVLWLVRLVALTVFFVYDSKWSLLPTRQMILFIVIALVFWILRWVQVGFEVSILINLVLSMIILPGTYFILNTISKGQWVGSGDWILSIGLIFLLPNEPIFAALVLFLSNFLGTVYILIMSVFKNSQIKKGLKIPFGPFLILATIIIALTYPQINEILMFLI